MARDCRRARAAGRGRHPRRRRRGGLDRRCPPRPAEARAGEGGTGAMSAPRRLGVLGGTFDPVHFGHLDAGDAAQSALELDEVRLVPSHDPPHRPVDPRASAFHRFALAALAVAERPSWRVSDVELARAGASYSIDTLRALHGDGWSARQIFFILGADAFAEIATWR